MKVTDFIPCAMCFMLGGIFTASAQNACTGVTCQNEGICQVLNGYPQCYCPFGYEGDFCETEFTDTTPPIISGCPQDITIFGTEGQNMSAQWNSPFIWDDSGRFTTTVTSEGAYWVNPYNGFFPPDIRTTVKFTVVDEAGNKNICEFYVTTATSCSGEPCLNGGTCIHECYGASNCEGEDVYWPPPRCDCTDTGFHGTICGDQESEPECFNGGTPMPYSPMCQCPQGYKGHLCEIELPLEKINPIVLGCPENIGTPIDNPDNQSMRIWWTPPTAYDDSGRFSFLSYYQPGQWFPRNYPTTVQYSAEDAAMNYVRCCSFRIFVTDAECSTDLGCQNGGTCLRQANQDLCFCPSNYVGSKCETEREDYVRECTASCSFGYEGERCESENGELQISAQLGVIVACIATTLMVLQLT